MRWVWLLTIVVACDATPAFTRLREAQRLASMSETELAKGAEAANRTLMADPGGPLAARQARQALERDLDQLEPVVRGLSYEPELALLERLRGELAVDAKLEAELVRLTGEGSNVQAQKLSFGPAHDAIDRFHAAAPHAFEAAYALRSIEALEGPHIAEADEAKMDALEERMNALSAQVRAALAAHAHAPEADAALHDFEQVHQRIITLSRRNTNVHALALAIGDKRAASVSCARTLQELRERLEVRGVPASR